MIGKAIIDDVHMDRALRLRTLTDLVPVPVPQAGVAQSLDQGQVLLEALQFAPQVSQHLCGWSYHGSANLCCLPVPAPQAKMSLLRKAM